MYDKWLLSWCHTPIYNRINDYVYGEPTIYSNKLLSDLTTYNILSFKVLNNSK